MVFRVLLHAVLFFPLGSKEGNGASLPVFSNEAGGRFLKSLHIADDPSAALIGEGSQDRFYAVLILEAVLHHFELELPYRCKNEVSFLFVRVEKLDGPFISELENAFIKGFPLADVFGIEFGKDFWLELGEGLELKAACDGKGVSDGKEGGVDHADHIAGIGDVEGGPFSCEHAVGAGEADFAA